MDLEGTDLEEGWDEAVQDAVASLGDLDRWTMSAERWGRVAELMDRIEAAFAARHGDGLAQAAVELEVAGPSRMERIRGPEGGQETRIPPPVFERRNMLVHALTSQRPAPREDGDGRRTAR